MRAQPVEYELVVPGSLPAVLALLAESPGQWLPIAGGTDLMVQYSAGKLAARKLVSIWNLPELRRIENLPDEIRIGAGCTYTDLRESQVINREFALLSTAAGWTGGIANQNRGTLGGNIVNGSPAADSLPALLVYEAELLLVSKRGERRAPYSSFHTEYRKTQLAPDELIRTVCLKKRFSEYYAHTRKVGTRNAQAISKVCMAALGRLSKGVIEDVRLAMGSVAPVPLRLRKTELVVQGKRIDRPLLNLARTTAAAEVQPIDDIRSTARYRAAVAGNLVAEFLEQLKRERNDKMSEVLARWNDLPSKEAAEEILPCCGSKAWAEKMAAQRPIADEVALLAGCDTACENLAESDWLEAFRSHPRIGERSTSAPTSALSAAWSGEEQRKVEIESDDVKMKVAEGNRAYEERFGRTFIICATGKSAPEILEQMKRRLQNEDSIEFYEAAEQQRQIARLRLKKWLAS